MKRKKKIRWVQGLKEMKTYTPKKRKNPRALAELNIFLVLVSCVCACVGVRVCERVCECQSGVDNWGRGSKDHRCLI